VLAIICDEVYVSLVRMLRHIAAFVILIAWLPVTTHSLMGSCLHEPEEMSCCGKTSGQQHQHNGSGDCGMCFLGSGNILIPASGFFVADFYGTLCWEILFPSLRVDLFKTNGTESGRAPPDLACWQFSTRAALPGRSPSCFV